MKFKVGDRIVVVKCGDKLYDSTFEDFLGETYTVKESIEHDDGTWYDVGDYNIHECCLIPEYIHISPLMKALR